MSDGTQYIIPCADTPHPLGRAGVWHDPANRNFPARELPRTVAAPRRTAWSTATVFDQGDYPDCTTEASCGLLCTSPIRATVSKTLFKLVDDETKRYQFYQRAQAYDPWAASPHDGSSTDAPLKLMRELGLIKEWRWLFGLAEVREHLQFKGPVIVGTNWYENMFHPDKHAFIRVGGEIAGGHDWRLVYYDARNQRYRMVQSWGHGWGENGRAWVTEADLERLLGEDGDAATVVV